MRINLIAIAAAFEAVTGLVLIVDPSLLGWLLLGSDLSVSGIAVGRLAGCALLGLGISAAVRGLLAYNALAAIFFVYLGIRGELVGPLLWPAAVIHALFAVLLARATVLRR
jgi:hypothetical protein